jgi:DNA topoisomerase-1
MQAHGVTQADRLPLDPHASAKLAECRYVDDAAPGIRRARAGKGFRYVSPSGKTIRDAATLRRIKSLVIPPAWSDVWICLDPQGHIQATGRDARRRKQYRYHPRFREIREETKYEKIIAFAEALPRIRARVDEDLSLPGLSRDKVLATVVRLLEITLIRVGNEEYARDNGSFGLTTMRTRHVDVEGATIAFHFKGKSGKEHVVSVADRRLSRVVARCNDLPGELLFQYADEQGELRSVEASDVNEYLKRVAGPDVTAKDFRTWAGTVLAAKALEELSTEGGEPTKKAIVEAVKSVAARLGNTPSVCRKCYVHPEIWGAYLDGALAPLARHAQTHAPHAPHAHGPTHAGGPGGADGSQATASVRAVMSRAEHAVLALLRKRLAAKHPEHRPHSPLPAGARRGAHAPTSRAA